MINKIKAIIAKAKEKMRYNRCYSNMEWQGVAVFGMCSGEYFDEEYKKQHCRSCPYYRKVG